jgi:diacylglycerol kinase
MNGFLKSFGYAVKGIYIAFREQRNIKIQFLIALITLGAGLYAGITATEWCIILLAFGLVLAMEMMNSAVEDLVNLVTHEWKPLAGKVKDIAAGAVLWTSVMALIIGIIIFWKYVPILHAVE